VKAGDFGLYLSEVTRSAPVPAFARLADKDSYLLNLYDMVYTRITSVSNQNIRQALEIKTRRSRYKHSAFLIEGPHLIEMALASGAGIKKVFFTSAFQTIMETRGLLRNLAKKTGEIFEIADHIIGRLTDTETPRGIVAVVSYQPLPIEKLHLGGRDVFTVIDGIQDPGNLGTIIRTADAAGAEAVVILPGTSDVFTPKAIRSTAGSIFNIPIVYTDTAGLISWLGDRKIKLLVTAVDAEKSIYEADLKGPLAMVFGNEAHGACATLKKAADLLLNIPIYGKAESLNVAASAAICLYEVVRQRKSG